MKIHVARKIMIVNVHRVIAICIQSSFNCFKLNVCSN